jgi:hypothetical protein
MRINIRAKFKNRTFFIMYAKTQSLIGITSKVIGDSLKRHYVFWDLENCTLEQTKEALRFVQEQYDLSDIFISSDYPKSYRAWCFTKVDFKTLCKIILDTAFIDYNFFYWTVQRGKATLRLTQKNNRPKQKLVAILPCSENSKAIFDNQIDYVEYDTGTEKKGLFLNLDFDRWKK